ncbi:MAG: efflux RND transporter permease subunit [Terriglobia bacterium]
MDLKPLAGRAEFAQSEIRGVLQKFPGAYFAIKTFLTERIEETISGVGAEVAVKIFGDDLDVMTQKAREVVHLLSGIEGAADVQLESLPGSPQMVVRLRSDRLMQLGFRPVEVLEAVQTGYQGSVVAQTYEGNRVFDGGDLPDPVSRKDP